MIGIILIVIVALIAVVYIYYLYERNLHRPCSMSFKESLDLTELPVVTFYHGKIKLNFLLDTGSTHSHINETIVKKLNYTPCNHTIGVSGMEGTERELLACTVDLQYKKTNFTENFVINPLDEVFTRIKQNSGVQLHGILGNSFFQKYKYVIDFNELIAYCKKV